MNFNYQKARELMVENQLRPNKIKDLNILNLFKKKPKEIFLPKNLHIAQLIKNAEIQKHHKVLHIGALTGYVTSLLSDLCFEVFAIEEENQHFSILKDNVNKNQIINVEIIKESFREGSLSNAPFDRIFIDCPVADVNECLLNQLSDDLGQMIMIKKNSENLSKAIKITKNKNNFSREFLFDVFSSYELYKEKRGFEF